MKTPTTLTGESRTCFALDKAEKRLTFRLQGKPAGEAACPNGTGGARTNFSDRASVPVQVPLAQHALRRPHPLWTPRWKPVSPGPRGPGGREGSDSTAIGNRCLLVRLLLQLKQHPERHKYQLSIICKESLSFAQKHSRNRVPFLPSLVEKDCVQRRGALLWQELRGSRCTVTQPSHKQGRGKQRLMVMARVNPCACVTFFHSCC